MNKSNQPAVPTQSIPRLKLQTLFLQSWGIGFDRRLFRRIACCSHGYSGIVLAMKHFSFIKDTSSHIERISRIIAFLKTRKSKLWEQISNANMAANIKRKISWRNFWICFSISLGQVAFGYPSSIIGTTLGQPAFLLYMGLVTPEGNVTPHATRYIGATSGVFQVCCTYRVSNNNSKISPGRRVLRYFNRQLGHGQMGQKSRRYILFSALHNRWSHAVRRAEYWNVHRFSILCRSWKLGISRPQ